MIRAVVFDIEGTIGDIAFVRSVLFPFARERLASFLASHWNDDQLRAILVQAREASGKPLATPDEAAALFAAWIDEDRKITPLKTLQGLIWRTGYETGVLKAHLYDDAIAAIRHYHEQGLRIFIYSSGSIEAQKLYMGYSVAGDLRPLISGYFDTTTGPKGEPASYATIARQAATSPGDMMFFSDATAEVSAALAAGMRSMLLCRSPGIPAPAERARFDAIESFTSLEGL
ncbi:MAG: acireductone synthase [Alphaproteobacteria bacterium]